MTDLATNVLSYGDNLDILRRYLPDTAVDLVDLDPPFNSNRDYNVIFRDEPGKGCGSGWADSDAKGARAVPCWPTARHEAGMSASRPIVVHHPEGTPGLEVPGIERHQQFGREGRWASWIRIESGNVTHWHHHAANDTYVYVSRGSVTLEFGPGGAESVVAGAGDFFHVPAETIHRETIGADVDFDGFVLRLGGGPERVDVDGPDAAEGSA